MLVILYLLWQQLFEVVVQNGQKEFEQYFVLFSAVTDQKTHHLHYISQVVLDQVLNTNAVVFRQHIHVNVVCEVVLLVHLVILSGLR